MGGTRPAGVRTLQPSVFWLLADQMLCPDVALALASASDANNILLTPVVGPEPITGSTRMKGGSATKIMLVWQWCTCAVVSVAVLRVLAAAGGCVRCGTAPIVRGVRYCVHSIAPLPLTRLICLSARHGYVQRRYGEPLFPLDPLTKTVPPTATPDASKHASAGAGSSAGAGAAATTTTARFNDTFPAYVLRTVCLHLVGTHASCSTVRLLAASMSWRRLSTRTKSP